MKRQIATLLFAGAVALAFSGHANAQAARLAGHIRASKNIRLAWEPQANEVFAVMTPAERDRLLKKGAMFFDWHTPHDHAGNLAPGEIICRFVTSYATSASDVDAFGKLIC